MSILASLKDWARTLKRDTVALWIAARDARTPLIAKLVAGVVAAYALSPIDLIPDFIPILGYLDEVILLPLGIRLAIWLIPPRLMDEFREKAIERGRRPVSRGGMIAIIGIWLLALSAVAAVVWRHVVATP